MTANHANVREFFLGVALGTDQVWRTPKEFIRADSRSSRNSRLKELWGVRAEYSWNN